MNTIAIVRNEENTATILNEFDDSISISDIIAGDEYEYLDEVSQHRMYKHLPSNSTFIYKQYEPDAYPVLKKLQELIFKSYYSDATTIFALGYNHELQVVETMEQYIAGDSLKQRLEERYSTIELYDLISIAISLCRFLDNLETDSIVLRDLSPQNIILESDYAPVIIDYNTACFDFYYDFVNDKPLGTIGYASPEHFELNEVSHKSDVYSLGIILNEMIQKVEVSEWDCQESVPIIKQLALMMISLDPGKRPNSSSLQFIFEELLDYDYETEVDTEQLFEDYLYCY